LGEGEGRVHGHFFAVRAAEGFRPGEFAGVALHFEVFVAFGFAEAEGFGIVANFLSLLVSIFLLRSERGKVDGGCTECYALARIHRRRAEVARLDTHLVAWCVVVETKSLVDVRSSVEVLPAQENLSGPELPRLSHPITAQRDRVFRINHFLSDSSRH
jgi:hypothetical protein